MEVLRNIPTHFAKIASTETGFKLSPHVIDMEVWFKKIQFLTFSAEKCWFGASWEKIIDPDSLHEFTGKLVIDWKFRFIYLMDGELDSLFGRPIACSLFWNTYLGLLQCK